MVGGCWTWVVSVKTLVVNAVAGSVLCAGVDAEDVDEHVRLLADTGSNEWEVGPERDRQMSHRNPDGAVIVDVDDVGKKMDAQDSDGQGVMLKPQLQVKRS